MALFEPSSHMVPNTSISNSGSGSGSGVSPDTAGPQHGSHPQDYPDYYYYYYYNNSVDYKVDLSLPLDEVIPVSLVYSLTLLLGLVGNSLVIFSISYYRRMRTVTNVFLLCLASADLLLVLVCVPIKAVAFFSFTWEFGEVLCKGVNYVQSYSMICSVLTLTVIAIERMVVVVFPLRAKYMCTMKHAQLLVLGVWAVSAVMALPTIFIYIHKEVGVRYKAFWCIKNDSEEEWSRLMLYETYMMVLLFALPVLIMIVAYTVIAVKVWDVSEMRTVGVVISTASESGRRSLTKMEPSERSLLGNGSTGNSSNNRQGPDERETRKQVVAMLLMVVFLFALCWAPILTNNVLTAAGHLHNLHYGYLKPMRQTFFLMSYFNSCLNPIVYAFFSRNFRQSFKMAICACVKGKAFVRAYRYSISVASTRRSIAHLNGRPMTSISVYDTGNGSSENDMTRSPTSYSPESMELHKI